MMTTKNSTSKQEQEHKSTTITPCISSHQSSVDGNEDDFSAEVPLLSKEEQGNNLKEQQQNQRLEAIRHLNTGTGVMDVAGGSGFVSLALALKGIKSTVIDPRENIGRLPGRHRKYLRKIIKTDAEKVNQERKRKSDGGKNRIEKMIILPPPPVQFSSLRAWFATRPDGVDVSFREGCSTTNNSSITNNILVDELSGNGMAGLHEGQNKKEVIPLCTICSPDKLLPSCTAIVALHPDEATGDIVDFAVKYRIPFVVVPCCVFSRLFPNRLKPLPKNENQICIDTQRNVREVVSTYDDLIEYLVDKDETIKVIKLDFDGANLCLWSTF